MNHRERVTERVEALRGTPGIEVTATRIGPPLSAATAAEARTAAGGRLPAGVEEFHRDLDGFTLEWRSAAPGEPAARGSIDLLPLARTFGDWRGVVWFDDFEGGDRFRPFKPFDYFVPEACAAFRQEPGAPVGDEVYYHYLGEDAEPLAGTFAEYLRLALLSCGFEGWHGALHPDDPATPSARRIREQMRRVVPDFDEKAFTVEG